LIARIGVERRLELRDVNGCHHPQHPQAIEAVMTTVSHLPKKGYRTIRLPLSEAEYDQFLTDRPYTKSRLEQGKCGSKDIGMGVGNQDIAGFVLL
jgi:hypothetical protein